ncbi:hypothetical protein ACH5RR_010977 [Cinchona calisaya]|uniref:DUF7950 domain-containing protein n=1 Tax=Cinchona calisaya TaxID=153742 RepID=A0ABD3A3L2_9GENT
MDVGKDWSAGGCAGGAHDKTIINRMMLRFRPIAPKPVADGSVSESMSAAGKMAPVSKQRTKRKYVRVNKNRRKCKTTEEKEKTDLQFDGAVVSLQTPALTGGTKVSPENTSFLLQQRPILMNFDKFENKGKFSLGLADQSDRAAATSSVRVVESWVVVVGMTETFLEVGGLGSTDREKMRNLEEDTCPGLISDGMNRVQWVNLAYKRMVDLGVGEEGAGEVPAEVVVWLVLKEKTAEVVNWPMFACTVRVVYTWRKEKYSRIMPCDVWKMDCGGFAWRLDAKAALSLGR